MMSKFKLLLVIAIFIVMITFIFNDKNNNFENDISNNHKENINIVMINSYQQGHYWEGFVLEGLKNKLSIYKDYDVNLKIEYLDFKEKKSEDYMKSFQTLLESKYADSEIDIIYAVNDEAYEFSKVLHNDKNSIFFEKPMVVTGVDQNLSRDEEHEKFDAIGFYPVDDTINLLKLILHLNKDVDTLNLIMEDSIYCDSVTKEIEDYLNNMVKLAGRDIKLEYIIGDYIEDIIPKLKNINQNNNGVNIVAGEFQSKDSNIFLNPKETIKAIKGINPIPIYSNDQTYLNAGILGGCVGLGQRHGEVAGELIIDVYNDLDLSSYNIDTKPLAEIYVDYKGIYEYGIEIEDINSEMNVINKKFYQLLLPKNAKMVMAIISIGITLVVVLFISEQIKVMEANKKAKENEKFRRYRESLKTDFIINLSHELRTPINLILNTTKSIKLNACDKSLQQNCENEVMQYIANKMNVIDTNSYRLLKISNNIIDITKAESGLLKLTFKNENIVSVIEEGFEACIDFAKNKNISMIFDSLEEEIITAIDEMQIKRVILNLISNAIKFTNANGTIYVNMKRIKKEVLIEVIDNGVGIPREKLDEIFQNFYQVDYSLTRKNEGTGIGLCIVKDIVGIHRGRIEVESEENKGSNFKVYLPIKTIKEDVNKEKIININYDIKTMANIELSDLI